jgi:methylated-DNA-protein-cysteine methyltransferase-like protein
VATYGQIAALAGLPGAARQVGYAMAALPDGSDVPWQRVINARGEVSPRAHAGAAEWQRHRLEEEGIRFGPGGRLGRLDLARYLWEPGEDPKKRGVQKKRGIQKRRGAPRRLGVQKKRGVQKERGAPRRPAVGRRR